MLKYTKDKIMKVLMIIVPIILVLIGLLLNVSFLYISLVSYLSVFLIIPIFYGYRFRTFYYYSLIIIFIISIIIYLDFNIKGYSNLFNISWIQSSVGYFSKKPIFPTKIIFTMLTVTILGIPVFINLAWATCLVTVVLVFDKVLKKYGRSEYLFVTDCVNIIKGSTLGVITSEFIMLTPWVFQQLKVGISNVIYPIIIVVIIAAMQRISYRSCINAIRSQYNKTVLLNSSTEDIEYYNLGED